jgi:hypothetical protein
MQAFKRAPQGPSSSLISIISSLIPVRVLGFTAYQNYGTHKRERNNLVPFLRREVQRQPPSGGGLTKMDWRLVNHGLGLAQIFPTSSNTAHRCRGDRLPKDASIDGLSVALPTPPLKEVLKKSKDLDDFNGIESALA